jgi:hypothetical protein
MTLEYVVKLQFNATNAISGHIRPFKPGEIFLCDAKRDSASATVTIEADSSFFLVDRSVFEVCCAFHGGFVA